MSHGTHEEQKVRLDRLKEAINQTGKNVAILLDTKGPEVRIGVFEERSVNAGGGSLLQALQRAKQPAQPRESESAIPSC